MKFLNFFSLKAQFRDESIKKEKLGNLVKKNYIFKIFFILDNNIILKSNKVFFYRTKKLDTYFKQSNNIIFIARKKNELFFCIIINRSFFKSQNIYSKTLISNIRDAIGYLNNEEAGLLTSGFFLARWIKSNRFCGKCGNRNKVSLNGKVNWL